MSKKNDRIRMDDKRLTKNLISENGLNLIIKYTTKMTRAPLEYVIKIEVAIIIKTAISNLPIFVRSDSKRKDNKVINTDVPVAAPTVVRTLDAIPDSPMLDPSPNLEIYVPNPNP